MIRKDKLTTIEQDSTGIEKLSAEESKMVKPRKGGIVDLEAEVLKGFSTEAEETASQIE